jgi:hypothetical protein
MSQPAMFESVTACRKSIAQHIPEIKSKDLQKKAVELLATVEQIERLNPGGNAIGSHQNGGVINMFKLAALHLFRELADATGGNYPLPDKGYLADLIFFTADEAASPPSVEDLRRQVRIDPKSGSPIREEKR